MALTRYIAIDHGTKRIGLAIGDSQLAIVSPLEPIQSRGRIDDDIAALLKIADEYGADEFVVGLPLNMDDTEGPQAKLTRQFGEAIQTKSGRKVHYFDERLSSFAADELLRDGDFTRKQHRSRQDGVAAQVLLQAFLDSRSNS